MKVLNPRWQIRKFFNDLSKVKQRLLMLDYDGTIAPFKVNRMEAFPHPEIDNVLKKLIKAEKTRVIIITGRPINHLLKLFNLAKTLEIWGSHGLEHLTVDGKYQVTKLEQVQVKGLKEVKELFDKVGLSKQYELKPGSIALHWRDLDTYKIEFIFHYLLGQLQTTASNHNLEICSFNSGIEFSTPGRNKGFAVKYSLSEIKEEVLSAYLGDDLTDEHAFKAIKNNGLAVLVGAELRATNADIYLESTDEVVDFFQEWLKHTT
ncbi:MAG: trehalose-phosphatase [Acidobacteria bacterium]|nr:trehalose-phosphatase [Acidobacteriota bacterium]